MGDVFGGFIGNQQIIKFRIRPSCNQDHGRNQCESKDDVDGIGEKAKQDNIHAQAEVGGKGIVKIPSLQEPVGPAEDIFCNFTHCLKVFLLDVEGSEWQD